MFTIIVIVVIASSCIYLTRSEATILPGVDDVRSGFDGAKMLSATEQRSRFRIFDLTAQSGTPYVLNVMGKQHRYSTPALTQVTDISTRKENNCVSVSYSYDEFYRSYFQSNSFGIGVETPKASLGIEYHSTLKQVYDAINKYSQAVGTSTVWWGLYSIQLAPSFLMKFDSLFNTSVNMLISAAANPTSEESQQLYNDFIQSYGTHYVSNVIVGGTANLYTFVNDNYMKTTSFEEVTQEISLTARYKEISFNAGSDTDEIYKQITETFRHNSNTMSIFQPPAASINNQSILQTWLNSAGQQPVVINRTLSHIANLIRSNSQVQSHLRQTVDYYLDTGLLPTLAQLNSGEKSARLVSPSPSSLGPIFGLDVVGCGYDILTLQSRSCILDTSNSSENGFWTDPYNASVSYSLPNGYFATNTPESLLVDATVLVTSVDDYYRYTTHVEVTEDIGFFSVRRVERRTTEFYRRFYQEYYNLVLGLKQIGWYTLAVSVFPYPQLTSVAKEAFAGLPTEFNANDTSAWEEFIASFGTHVTVASQMGGQVWAESWYETCLTYERTEIWIDEQIRNTFAFIFQSDSYSNDHTFSVDELFKKYSIYSAQLLGGTESIPPEKWQEWASTVKYNPRPISYRLIPIYDVLPQGNQRSALQAAIEYISKKVNTDNEEYIAQLQSIGGPPPTKCGRNRVRRLTPNPTTASQINDTLLRKFLCPYVGYSGSTCAGSTDREAFVPAYHKLPVGVGMTIDITTGNLLLPALDFTQDNTTFWKDPLTDEIYWTPREVSWISADDSDNQPIARVFLSATELANHWKYAQTQGDWLGGEFGHSKSILDLQTSFFDDDQAIAITQEPRALYRLKIEELTLNTYVKNAISLLPKTYNEGIYADFLRNWGTHIVLQSVIGGMHEQQVLFKDCLFSFNGAVTPANLDTYLKQDILAQTLGNSFYADRRKISIDHRLGGDPTLSNVTQWQRSLGVNPALLKIEQLTPWYEVVQDPDIQANFLRIIKNRTDAYEQVRIQEEAQIMQKRANERIAALKSSIGLLNNGFCNITTPVMLDSVDNCSSGCDTKLKITSRAGFLSDRPLWYVRDPATGFVQARVQLQDGTILDGARVSVGCSTITIPSMLTTSASICVKCTLVSSFLNACTCVCPVYPAPLTTSSPTTTAA